MAKPQWISASDPYFDQFTYQGEFGPENPYSSTIAGLQTPELWKSVARSLGYSGPFETQVISSDPGEGGGGLVNVPAPEFLQFIQQKKAEGYDFVTKGDQIDKDNQTVGLKTPTGEVVAQRPVKAAGFGEFFKEFVLPAVAAYGAVNFLGPRLEGLTNALSGGGQITAADLASIPTNAMGQVSQTPGLEVMDLAPLESTVTNVTTPAAAATDAANAMQLSPVTQLQPITLAGEPYLTAGAGGGASATAATNALAPAAGLSAEALDAALAGAGGGAGAGAAGATGGNAALQALGGSLQAGTTPGALGSVIGSTGTGAAIAAGAAPTILDQAIDLLKSPAGQAVVGGVGSVAGGVMQANAAEAAANQQAEAARNALQLQREMFEYQKELLDPYRKRGEAALTRLSGALGLEGPAQAQQMLEMDPGYGFRLGEGMKALERMQAARGNMLSGGALKAGQRYAQDYASGEYQNAYNRLANIAGLGQTVGGQLGTAAQQFGTSAGNVMGQEANALAAGRIGRGSAYSGGIQGGLNAFQNYFNRQQEEQLFRDIFGRTAVGG